MKWGAMKGIGIARIGLVAAGLTAAVLTTGAEAQEGELVKSLLSNLGVVPQDKDPIDYRERPPLVLPPRMELRQPMAPGAEARNPQWPNDPDVAERRRRAAEAGTPPTETDLYRTNGQGNRLSIYEMRAGRRAGAGVPSAPVAPKSTNDNWVNPDVLRAQEREGRSAQVADGDEATRRSLTDPPSTYRRSATGQPIKGSFAVPERVDEADPKVFHRQMRGQ
jgi:hypothetical protein